MRKANHDNVRGFIIAITFIGLFAGVATAQSAYNVPKKVSLDAAVKRTFPVYFGRQRYPQLYSESFYPIGWSKDGKFAYYVEPVDEACGCYYAQLVIQDMRTDKVVWEFKYNQDDTYEGDTMTGPGDLRTLWAKNRKLFSEKLAENGIVALPTVLLGKTFTAAGRSFTAKAVQKMGPNKDEYGDRVNFYTVSLSSPKIGSKKVFTSEDHTKDDYWFMLNAGVIGAIKSPFENRVAIIASEVMRGYEGPPHTAQIRIIGADLISGFGR